MQKHSVKISSFRNSTLRRRFLTQLPQRQPCARDFHNENIVFKYNTAVHLLDLEEIRLESVDKLYYTPYNSNYIKWSAHFFRKPEDVVFTRSIATPVSQRSQKNIVSF